MQHICVVFGNPLLASTNIKQLAHIRMDFGGIMQSVWNRMEYVALYHILPLAVFSRF